MEYFIDHYKILNLSPEATEKDIKKAFWSLAKIYHPDKGGDPYKFHQIYISYQFLLDQEKRLQYDKFYQQYKQNKFIQNLKKRYQNAKVIETYQFQYIVTLKTLLNNQIRIKTIKKKDRLLLANIRYDYEVNLTGQDFERDLIFKIPILLYSVCTHCFGKDLNCSYCKGLGRYKTEGIVRIFIPAHTLHPGQIIRINLEHIKTKNPLILPKKKQISIMIQKKLY
ncbi:MAG: hypothetical protein KatS3mg129_0476 [Leptospiraceae bacterium]|nr:MAG: hypothetical protein KatS3mg129_0476 [Leptospiraceae bacterium]